MLVLTRRTSDQVLIPSLGITLEVLSIKGNVVKLGISAPQEVRIFRGELEGIEPGRNKIEPGRNKESGRNQIESGLKKARPIVKTDKCDAPQPSNSLRAYLQRAEKPETATKSVSASNVPSRSAVIPVLSLPEEASEIIRETRATYEVCT